MDKSETRKLIDTLELAQQYLGKEITNKKQQSVLSEAYGVYNKNFELWTKQTPNPTFTNFQTFVLKGNSGDLQPLIDFLWFTYFQNQENKKEKEQKKEESSIPSNLEDLVYQYKEFQADQINIDNSEHSVAEAVKRARQTWDRRNRLQTILKNRQELDKANEEADIFIVNTVDPKSLNKKNLLSPIENIAEQAVETVITVLNITVTDDQRSQAIQDIIDLQLSGSLDINNLNNLNLVSQLALLNSGVPINSQITELNSLLSKQIDLSNQNPYSDEPEKIDSEIQDYLLQHKDKIESYSENGSKSFADQIKETNQDIDIDLDHSQKRSQLIFERLSTIISKPKDQLYSPTPLDQHSQALESAIRKIDPSFSIETSGLASRTQAILRTSQVNDRLLNPTIVDLYGKGLTLEKLTLFETYAQQNPKTEIGRLFQKQPDVFSQVRFQIEKLQKSKIGQEISADQSTTKPLGKLGSLNTSLYNKLPSSISKSLKVVLDPVGSLKSYVNKKIGQQVGSLLIKNTNSVIVKKIGSYLIDYGLKEGINKFTSSIFSKVVTKVATKAGMTIAAEGTVATISAALGISTGGVSLLIEAAVYLGWQIISSGWNVIKKITKEVYGEEIDFKQLAGFSASLGAATIAGTTAVVGGVYAIFVATRLAVFSAFWIVIIATITFAAYLGVSLSTGTLLSTFVQLDSQEKVIYTTSYYSGPINCTSMPWPFDGTYAVTQGPNTTECTHHGGIAQSADFATPIGTPIKSMTDGKVILAQQGSTGYGNHVIIQATTDSGESFQIIYAHFSSLNVSTGTTVKAGQIIGLSGNTGYSTGPHLHLGYIGGNVAYNSCPAGGFQINEGCCINTACNQP